MFHNNQLFYSFKSSFQGMCVETTWQQKYAACLKGLGIITKVKKSKGKYTFNLNHFCYILYSMIMEEEKKLLIDNLLEHKKRIFKKYDSYFNKHEALLKKFVIEEYDSSAIIKSLIKGLPSKNYEVFSFKPKLKVKSEKEATDLNWLAKQILEFQDEIKDEIIPVFDLFGRRDLGVRIWMGGGSQNQKEYHLNKELIMPKQDKYIKEGIIDSFSSLKSQITLSFDELIYWVETFYDIDNLKGKPLEYFIESMQKTINNGVNNYSELRKRLTLLWKKEVESKNQLALFMLPYWGKS